MLTSASLLVVALLRTLVRSTIYCGAQMHCMILEQQRKDEGGDLVLENLLGDDLSLGVELVQDGHAGSELQTDC